MTAPTRFRIKRNDTIPSVQIHVTDKTGTAYDLTNLSYARFRLFADDVDRTQYLASAAAIVDPATDGVLLYTFLAGETVAAGEYLAELRLVWDDGRAITVPSGFMRVTIYEDLG